MPVVCEVGLVCQDSHVVVGLVKPVLSSQEPDCLLLGVSRYLPLLRFASVVVSWA